MVKKSLDIQVLRAIAVLLVVAYHFELSGATFGFLGVDVFFVISGFLMQQLYGNISTRLEVLDFITRRARRIIPSYLLCLAIFYIFSVFALRTFELRGLISELKWHLLFLTNFHEWTQEQYFSSDQFRPFLNFWSLAIEIQFYLLFPILVTINRFRKGNVYLIVLFFASLFFFLVFSVVSANSAFYLLPMRLWEFMAGMFVAMLREDTKRKLVFLSRFKLSPFSLAILVFVLDRSTIEIRPGFVNLFAVSLTSACLYTIGDKYARTNPYIKVLVFFGNHSYAIYLYHLPVQIFFNYVPFEGNIYEFRTITSFIAAIVMVVVLVCANNYLAEKPAAKLIRVWNVYKGLMLISLTLALILSGTVGKIYGQLDDSRARSIADSQIDRGKFRCGLFHRNTIAQRYFVRLKYCPLNDSINEFSALLVGNSHADSIKEIFALSAEAAGISPYLVQENNNVSSKNIADILESVRLLRPHVVVLHSKAGSYDLSSLEKFIDALLAMNSRVIIIESVPTFDQEVPRILLENYSTFWPVSYVDYSNFDSERRKILKLMKSLNFDYLKTRSLFCPIRETLCQIADNDSGLPFYYDSSHLTLTGASVLREEMTKVLETIKLESNTFVVHPSVMRDSLPIKGSAP